MAINPGSLTTHTNWANKFDFPFPICVDTDKKVATAYGVVRLLGLIQRSVILVNPQGYVGWVSAGMPDTAEILNAIKA